MNIFSAAFRTPTIFSKKDNWKIFVMFAWSTLNLIMLKGMRGFIPSLSRRDSISTFGDLKTCLFLGYILLNWMKIVYKSICTVTDECMTNVQSYFSFFYSYFLINQKEETKKKSMKMIHSARPTVSPVVNIIFVWNLLCFARFWTVGRPSGSKELMKMIWSKDLYFSQGF